MVNDPLAALPKVAWGKGIHIYDQDGKRYIDASGGPATFCLGHGNEEVNQAIKEQLDRIAFGYRYHFRSDVAEELAEVISERAGGDLNHVIFTTGGSESVEGCLKLALQYHAARGEMSRRRFISRQRSWHGNTLGALSISGFEQRQAPYVGSLLDVSHLSPVNTYRPPEGVAPENVGEYCANELEEEIQRVGAENVAAFIFEPLVGAAGGAVPAPDGYAQRIREICDRHGVLMIADEVMCGVGRCGTWRALEHDGVFPDLMPIAKGLGGGYQPLGACVYSEKVAEPIYAVHGMPITGHTFTAHTAACAAGLAVQRIMDRENLVQKVADDGIYLRQRLEETLGQHTHIGDIRGRGFFQGIELVEDRETKEPFDPEARMFYRVLKTGFEKGLIVYPTGGNVDGVKGDQIIVAPPYNATRDELDEIVDLLGATIDQAIASWTA
ncbi:MAG: aspartate aminotransferase family protein [Alphaproteobacteria bacterium]|nr:aspartate aminotransferase family protein [Alphaproteobacteria bacterium]